MIRKSFSLINCNPRTLTHFSRRPSLGLWKKNCLKETNINLSNLSKRKSIGVIYDRCSYQGTRSRAVVRGPPRLRARTRVVPRQMALTRG